MRRILAGLISFLTLTGTFLVLPVYAAPLPEPEPVPTSTEQVDMGSVADPAPEAVVQEGTTDPVVGISDATPTLTVSQPDTSDFSLVGVTWSYDAAVTDTVVQVRVRDERGTWGSWTEVTVEDADQNADADTGADLRGGTAPLWTGPSTGVEAELVTRAGAQPADVTLDLVDPGTSDADTALDAPDIQDTADAATAMPDVFSREQWGADESIRSWDPEYAPTIRAATLHHTADTNDYTADQVPAMIRSIYQYHTVSRGWGDIGYNVIVDKFGRLWEGRYGGLASTVIGAHVGGFNTGTFGVSMLGNYDTSTTPPAMIDAVAAIIAWKFSLYGVEPTGTVTLTSSGGGTSRYAAGQRVPLPTIFGHRDVGNTIGPGRYGYAQLPLIRSIVARTSPAASLITSLYQDQLGRTPADAELDQWTQRVVQAGDRWVAVRGFSGSEEYRRRFIAEAYHDILGRAPDMAGTNTWLAEIASGRLTPDRLRSTFMASREFYLQGGGTDEGFVDLMYQRSFNRSASTGERQLWAGTLRSQGKAEAIRGVWDSYESALHRVDRSYQRWLGRAATSPEQSYWASTVVTAGDESMREAAMVSQEYLLRAGLRFP